MEWREEIANTAQSGTFTWKDSECSFQSFDCSRQASGDKMIRRHIVHPDRGSLRNTADVLSQSHFLKDPYDQHDLLRVKRAAFYLSFTTPSQLTKMTTHIVTGECER